MKTLIFTTLLLSLGCAARPIRCRIVALDHNLKPRKDIPPTKWYPANECAAEVDVLQMLPPRRFGLEVRGSKKAKQQFYDFVNRPEAPEIPKLSTTANLKD